MNESHFKTKFLVLFPVITVYIKAFLADPACKPEVVGSRATFNLDLDDIYQCMVTRVVDRSTVMIKIMFMFMVMIKLITNRVGGCSTTEWWSSMERKRQKM